MVRVLKAKQSLSGLGLAVAIGSMVLMSTPTYAVPISEAPPAVVSEENVADVAVEVVAPAETHTSRTAESLMVQLASSEAGVLKTKKSVLSLFQEWQAKPAALKVQQTTIQQAALAIVTFEPAKASCKPTFKSTKDYIDKTNHCVLASIY
jgi:hypothetical protein